MTNHRVGSPSNPDTIWPEHLAPRKLDSPEGVSADYDFSQSTEENYACDQLSFFGKYASIRQHLDYQYHRNYVKERQLFQDRLMDMFNGTVIRDGDLVCESPTENWLVFTAGPMGAGKSHTLNWLSCRGLFPLESFVRVDPDSLRELLPEMPEYIKRNPMTAGHLTQKEVGYISELLTLHALLQGKNVLVDGSLRDAEWYTHYISSLRTQYNKLKIAILHVTASEETVLRRAAQRACVTGRVVPERVLLDTMRQLQQSIRVLAPMVDVVIAFQNEDESEGPRLLLESELPSFVQSEAASAAMHKPSSELPLSLQRCPRTLTEFQDLWIMRCPMPARGHMHRKQSRSSHRTSSVSPEVASESPAPTGTELEVVTPPSSPSSEAAPHSCSQGRKASAMLGCGPQCLVA